jgi:hypothetical protein
MQQSNIKGIQGVQSSNNHNAVPAKFMGLYATKCRFSSHPISNLVSHLGMNGHSSKNITHER